MVNKSWIYSLFTLYLFTVFLQTPSAAAILWPQGEDRNNPSSWEAWIRNENVTRIDLSSDPLDEDEWAAFEIALRNVNKTGEDEPPVFTVSLNLKGTAITSLSEDFGENFKELVYLNVSNAQLKRLPKNIGRGMPKLRQFHAANNEISHLTSGMFLKTLSLKRLNLNFNKIQSIENGWGRKLKSLEFLALSHNELAHLPDDFTSGMPHLTKLYLVDNHLISLPSSIGEPPAISPDDGEGDGDEDDDDRDENDDAERKIKIFVARNMDLKPNRIPESLRENVVGLPKPHEEKQKSGGWLEGLIKDLKDASKEQVPYKPGVENQMRTTSAMDFTRNTALAA